MVSVVTPDTFSGDNERGSFPGDSISCELSLRAGVLVLIAYTFPLLQMLVVGAMFGFRRGSWVGAGSEADAAFAVIDLYAVTNMFILSYF